MKILERIEKEKGNKYFKELKNKLIIKNALNGFLKLY